MSDGKIEVCKSIIPSNDEALQLAILEEVLKDKEIAFKKMGCSKDILTARSADRREELVIQCVQDKLRSVDVNKLLTDFSMDAQMAIQSRAERFLKDSRLLVEKIRQGGK